MTPSLCELENATQAMLHELYLVGDGLILVTKLADPQCIFAGFLTIAYQLLPFERATKLLLAFVLGDTSNALLKWLFFGDRPYWLCPGMKQFELTCESGFGMPSGHCMVSVAFWSCLFFTWPKKESRREGEEVQKCSGEGARWLLFGALCIWGGLVALSRVYIAAHTFWQVAFGLVAGFAVGAMTSSDCLWECLGGRVASSVSSANAGEEIRIPSPSLRFVRSSSLSVRSESSPSPSTATGSGLFASFPTPFISDSPLSASSLRWLASCIVGCALAEAFLLFLVIGESPDDVSVRRARIGCIFGKKGVHLSTAPLTAICRDAGVLVGLSLLFSSVHFIRLRKLPRALFSTVRSGLLWKKVSPSTVRLIVAGASAIIMFTFLIALRSLTNLLGSLPSLAAGVVGAMEFTVLTLVMTGPVRDFAGLITAAE